MSEGRILVIDDEPSIVKWVGAILGDEGYEVTEARDGEEGLQRIEDSLEPRRAEAFRGRALAYDALGQQARAAEDYQEATRLSRLPGVVNGDSSVAADLRTALDFLSSYGPRVLAAIGTGLIGAAVLAGSVRLRRWMDRPLLRTNARLDYLHDLQRSDGVLKLFLEARNPHSRPVTVQSLGLELGSRANPLLVVIPQAGYVFPHEVKKGESVIEWADIREVVDKIEHQGGSLSDLKWVWFKTSTGERHRARLSKYVLRGLSRFLAPRRTTSVTPKRAKVAQPRRRPRSELPHVEAAQVLLAEKGQLE